MSQGAGYSELIYDQYNREERYTCTHLFRLLHEPSRDYWALRQFLGGEVNVAGFRIFAEVALIRDAYHERRLNPNEFMDALVGLVVQQEDAGPCRMYSQLDPDLCTPRKTHPREIRYKAAGKLSDAEKSVYGAMQGMFNAKPDLVVCLANDLIVYEAKLTLAFDNDQLKRTRNIADAWARLLYRDLGFTAAPAVSVRTLGAAKFKPDVSWERVKTIAEEIYPKTDRTRRALSQAAAFCAS